eukprot:TRINITY_DN9640_c0_g1_i1.p1 TRINITY_DN9640_c0_g1~~TRINITY_DN9640_c0_g1_i1.p1  ORF type:complete len:107 (-),score=34.48 TRINITY_DN9640_c0_g1_i1:269-589(-)
MSYERTRQQQQQVIDRQNEIIENQHKGVDTLERTEQRSEDLQGFSATFQKNSTEAREETDSCCCSCFGKKDKFDAEAAVEKKHQERDRQAQVDRQNRSSPNVVATH